MIKLYSGTPGSGKSLHQASDLYWRIRTGKPTICNYAVNTAWIKGKGEVLEVDNTQLRPQLLRDFANNYYMSHKFAEGSISVYIDEAQLLFNCRDNNMSGSRKDWIDFFSQHRKYGYDIILIAQFDRMLDRQIRSLIEYEYIHRKVSNFGWKGWIVNLVMGGKMHCCVSMWYPMRERIGAEFFRVKKKYYRIYDSYKDFGHNKPGKGEHEESNRPAPDQSASMAQSTASTVSDPVPVLN